MGRSADTWQVNRTADCDGTAGVRASSQARTRRRTSGSDATAETGFTLIEVILVVILAPMIVGAIALASITVMRGVSTTNPNSTANNVADSTDAQLISAYFTRDVQSAALITTSSSASNPAVCGSGGAMLVSFAWPATPTSEVTYWTSAGGTTLTRVYCTVSGAVATVASTATLAHGFPPTGSVGITSNTPLPVGAWSATQQYGVTL
ncbi:MAG TPA: hypothetical protein VE991_02010, partial [Acidimicrobiales bacterium]|nr:hypothetical protein [Acidimicrobiales bacterium]